MQQFPFVPPELVRALQEAFPDRVPELADSDREVWVKVGHQKVVRFLAKKVEEQEEALTEELSQHVHA